MFARSYSKVAISPLSRYTLPMDLEVLPPTDDWVFKLLFGDQRNQRILIRFLRSFMELPPEEYQGRMFLNPHLKPEATDDKLGILDVKIKTPSGRILNLEIQVYPVKYLEKRLAFYLAKLIVEQIGKGERYGVIQPVVCICIADYDLFPRDSGYMGHFEFCKRQNGQWLEQVPLELYTIELPKAPEREDGSLVWEWVQFLRGRKKEEFEMLAERNADMREAVDMLYEISADEETRAVYEMRQKAWRDRMSQFQGYFSAITDTMEPNSILVFNDVNNYKTGRDKFDRCIAQLFNNVNVKRYYNSPYANWGNKLKWEYGTGFIRHIQRLFTV